MHNGWCADVSRLLHGPPLSGSNHFRHSQSRHAGLLAHWWRSTFCNGGVANLIWASGLTGATTDSVTVRTATPVA